MVSPGLSSTPANTDPIITVLAPATKAFTTSPVYRIPPSAINGTLNFFSADAASITAVICGTPAPATIRVVQMEPGPIPTFTPSAPASASAFAPAAVPIFPAMTSSFGKFFFTDFNASITPLECPCALSKQTTSTPICCSAAARSSISPVIPSAAPASNLPNPSFTALG